MRRTQIEFKLTKYTVSYNPNVDITRFFQQGKKVRVVSDPEGCNIIDMAFPKESKTDLKCRFNDLLELECEDNVVVCGDILDSTFLGKIPEEHMDKYSFNLRNIMLLLVKRDHMKLVVGNRDINKIKVFPLAELARNFPEGELSNEEEIDLQLLIQEYNNGTLEISTDTFNKLRRYSKFSLSNLNNFYPFWHMKNGGEYNGKDWNYTSQDTFHQRYLNIFGADTNKPGDNTGTMSAQNTIETFYHELKILHPKLVEQESNIAEEDMNDYKAFIVLAVYRSLLYPCTAFCSESLKFLNTACYRGLLYNLLRYSYVNAYSYTNGKFIMYSHGGILRETSLRTIYDSLDENNLELLSNFDEYRKQRDSRQSGGYYGATKRDIDMDEFIKTLNENQKYYSGAFESMILYTSTPTPLRIDKNMTFLLMIAVPFNSNNFIDKAFSDTMNVIYLSPIQVNFDRVREGFFFLKDKRGNVIETIQVFGHLPNGFSNTIDYYEYTDDLKQIAKAKQPAPPAPTPQPSAPPAPEVKPSAPPPEVKPSAPPPVVKPSAPPPYGVSQKIEELKEEIELREKRTDFDTGADKGYNSYMIMKLKEELQELEKQSQSKIQKGGDTIQHGWAICIDTSMTHTHSPQGTQSYNYLSIDGNHTIVSKGEINLSNMKKGKLELNNASGTLGNETDNKFNPSHQYYTSQDIETVQIEQKITSNSIEEEQKIGQIIKTISKDDFIINVHKTGENTVLMIKHPKTAGPKGGFNKMLLIMNKGDIEKYLN